MDSDSEKLIRLLIVDEGLHQAEVITSSLRSSGIHVLAEFAEDSTEMCDIIVNKSLDLLLFSMDLPDFSLQQVQHLIRECGRHLSVIGISKEVDDEKMIAAMKDGAQDLIKADALDHLALVIKREADSLKSWRKSVSLEKELHESEKRCQSLLSNSKDAVAYVHEGMHIYANEPYMELFGCTDIDELEATPLIDMIDGAQQNEVKTFLRDFNQHKNETNELKLKLVHRSGETIEGLLEFSRASYDGEPCTQILIRSQADTSELEEQINYLHQHDLVTGLYNRQYFMEKLQTCIDNAINGEGQSVMLYLAIDNFQNVRDSVGISGCDVLINDIAQILMAEAQQNELVARFGAYTYTILCADKEKSDIEKNTDAMLKKIEQHISEVGNQSISATCSLSIYHIDENSPDNSNEIIARAEKTVDRIQHDGGNASMLYVPVAGEMTQAEEDGLIVKHIKAAVASNSINALYQPIVSIGEAGGERYEIKKTIITEDGTELTEEEYMPAAERTGTAKTLDRWAIINAVKLIASEAQTGRKLDIFIPLSCDSIMDASLTRWIAQRIQSAKISGEQLVFTMNEAHAVNQLKSAKTLFKGLKQLHCQIALDGFGTGLNPFQLVKHIQADFLRINTAFVDGLATNEENQNSIRDITSQ
ncbi:MAG: EAL domain-containing protein, partial [Gammaproteobacteria bacterium]|nr:EAL domain-containing protein [Gammaproteobacteria bacterium]